MSMPSAVDYQSRSGGGWVRRHRRTIVLVCLTVALAWAGWLAKRPVERYVQWPFAWRQVARVTATVDRPIDEQLAAFDQIDWDNRPPRGPAKTTPAYDATERLLRTDRGFNQTFFSGMRGGLRDVRVFHMRRPDGTPRLAMIDVPYLFHRPFDDVSVALLREPALGDFSINAVCNEQSSGMTANGLFEQGVAVEIGRDTSDATRLRLTVAARPRRDFAPERMTFEGELTDDDRIRWRLIAAERKSYAVVHVTPGSVFEFIDGAGRIIEAAASIYLQDVNRLLPATRPSSSASQ